METNNFKVKHNYKEQIDGFTDEVINTCQDCIFSTYSKHVGNNELHCIEGNITVNVNGICNNFISVL